MSKKTIIERRKSITFQRFLFDIPISFKNNFEFGTVTLLGTSSDNANGLINQVVTGSNHIEYWTDPNGNSKEDYYSSSEIMVSIILPSSFYNTVIEYCNIFCIGY